MPSENVRRRKLAQNEAGGGGGGDTQRPSIARRKASGAVQRKAQQQNLLFSFICLLACVFLFIIFFGFYADIHPVIDSLATSLGYQNKQYAVVIDAGSTGSRVLAYEFHRGVYRKHFYIDNELFKEQKPGLSSYVDDPESGALRINQLLDEARKFIPRRHWPTAPLVLRATAGLRLLDPIKAENLLNSVRDLFNKSGFLVDSDSVQILDGDDEGIFSWFTVNYLLNRLNRNTFAALDLGGGSTQVTFVPKDLEKSGKTLKPKMHPVQLDENEVNVFTHSYLGLGLQAVRQAVFSAGQPKDAVGLESVCLNPIIVNADWKYANKVHKVSGAPNPSGKDEVDFGACQKVVREKTLSLVKPKPVGLPEQQIVAFSYFYERAIENGLMETGEMGPAESGTVLVGDFALKAKEVCGQANVDQKFMCTDLVYISVLLEEGYGLSAGVKLHLVKKIDGHEISWALGCAYSLLK